MRRYVLATAITMVAAALLVGCTTSKAGNATPGGSTTSAPPASSSGSGAPKVATPLDVSRYQQAPCEALTQAQIDQNLGAGITPDSEPDAPGGPACVWHAGGDSQASVNLGFVAKGLSRIYDGQGTLFRFFKPMDAIQGHPAAAYGTTDDRMTRGKCTVAVGASDSSTIDVAVSIFQQNVGKKDPCDSAYQVAKLVVSNIKGGS